MNIYRISLCKLLCALWNAQCTIVCYATFLLICNMLLCVTGWETYGIGSWTITPDELSLCARCMLPLCVQCALCSVLLCVHCKAHCALCSVLLCMKNIWDWELNYHSGLQLWARGGRVKLCLFLCTATIIIIIMSSLFYSSSCHCRHFIHHHHHCHCHCNAFCFSSAHNIQHQ